MKRNQLPAAALLAAALLLASACGSNDDTSKDAAPSPATETTAATQLIDYGDEGVPIKTLDDVAKLHDAPDDFKQFIAGVASQVLTPKSATDKCGPYIIVTKFDPAGFAQGGSFDCGGGVLIWAKADGIWREVFGGQYVPPCELTEKYSVPEEIIGGKCDDSGVS